MKNLSFIKASAVSQQSAHFTKTVTYLPREGEIQHEIDFLFTCVTVRKEDIAVFLSAEARVFPDKKEQ